MKTYKNFIKEGADDYLKPKTDEDIKKMSPFIRIREFDKKRLPDRLYPTKEEIKEAINDMSPIDALYEIDDLKLYEYFTDDEIKELIRKIINTYTLHESDKIKDFRMIRINSGKYLIVNSKNLKYKIYNEIQVITAWNVIKTFMD